VKDKTLDLRNERWPKEQVRDTLFELFAEQPSFSLKELYEKISQPKVFFIYFQFLFSFSAIK